MKVITFGNFNLYERFYFTFLITKVIVITFSNEIVRLLMERFLRGINDENKENLYFCCSFSNKLELKETKEN